MEYKQQTKLLNRGRGELKQNYIKKLKIENKKNFSTKKSKVFKLVSGRFQSLERSIQFQNVDFNHIEILLQSVCVYTGRFPSGQNFIHA